MYEEFHERRVTMKTTALAFAALVALSGAAFAGEAAKTSTAPAACTQALKAKVDCTATGSVEKAQNTGKADAKGPRLGIDVNPWIMPSTF
jgi:hypothetical protein